MRACRLLDILPDGGLTYDGGQRRVIPASGSRGLFFIRRNASRKHAFYNLILTQPSSDRQRPAEDHPDDGWVRGQPRWLHGAMHAQNTVKLINKYCAGFCCVTCMYVCVCVCVPQQRLTFPRWQQQPQMEATVINATTLDCCCCCVTNG